MRSCVQLACEEEPCKRWVEALYFLFSFPPTALVYLDTPFLPFRGCREARGQVDCLHLAVANLFDAYTRVLFGRNLQPDKLLPPVGHILSSTTRVGFRMMIRQPDNAKVIKEIITSRCSRTVTLGGLALSEAQTCTAACPAPRCVVPCRTPCC